MPAGKVKCAFCKQEVWPDKACYCDKCEFWVCNSCVAKRGVLTQTWHCPRCDKKLA